MSEPKDKEAEITKFPGIASLSLSVTPISEKDNFEVIEAVVRIYDDNNEQIMQHKARSLFSIAKALKMFIQNRTNLPINDRRLAVWCAIYFEKLGIKLGEEEAYQIIKKASQALEKLSRVTIEHVEASDLVSIEVDVLANQIALKSDHLLSEDELYDMLEKHQTPVSNTVLRKISYKNSGGVEHKDKLNLEITPSELILEHNLVASFKNETEHKLANIIVSDIIPYLYKIKEVTCKEGGKHKQELVEGGLKITWKVSSLPPSGEVKAFYTLEKRIPRTIMIRKGEEIRIVQDYNSLLREEDEDGKVRTYFTSEVLNLLPVTLDELFIRDLIPTEMQLTEETITDEMEFIDFGLKYGMNIQQNLINVESGTKFLQKYIIKPAPLVWRTDLSFPIKDESCMISKILEKAPKENTYICTIVSSTPVPCTITNQVESGLVAAEFLPSELAPGDEKEMLWDIDKKFSVSFVLKGNLSRQINSPKVIINGKEHTAKISEIGNVRKSKIITLPFTHVAMFRKFLREM